MLSRGVEVFVVGGRLSVRLLTPVPVPPGGLPLEPDDVRDPYVFRLDLSRFGMPPIRVAFAMGPQARATAAHTDLEGQPLSLVRSDGNVGRRLVRAGLAGFAVATAARSVRRRGSGQARVSTGDKPARPGVR